MCVLSDHQPANHQEFELSVTGGVTVNTGNSKEHCAQDIISEFEDARTQRISSESDTVMFEGQNEHCAQAIISEFEDARTQKVSSESNTVVINAEIHAENTDAQHIVHFEEAQDAGSLITQAPQSQSIHATINALSTWVSAIQPRESWYLAGWIGDSPIDFLVDPGAVVSAISLQSYEKLITPMRAMHLELEAANKSDMRVHGMCNLELSVHGLIINIDAVVVDLNCHAILGMDILGDASKLPFILDLVKGTLSGGGYETIQLHRFQAATECFAEYESYDEVRAQQQRATSQKEQVMFTVDRTMEWVVGIQIDADARIVYVHMDDLKRCAPPNPEPTWPDTARGTSIVVSTRTPSTLALSDVISGQNIPDNTSHQPRSSVHHPQSVTSGQTDVTNLHFQSSGTARTTQSLAYQDKSRCAHPVTKKS